MYSSRWNAISQNTVGTISIPETLSGCPVQYIQPGAFLGCSGLTSITIPDTVTRIGDAAFSDCSGLTSITIPDAVTSIGDAAFFRCSGLASITIPSNVRVIGSDAFARSGLASISIPASVQYMDFNPFEFCPSLVSVVLEPGCTTIWNQMCCACEALTSITIPNSVTSIGASAFRDCSGLTSITIPDSVTSIGNYALSGCSRLANVSADPKWGSFFSSATNFVFTIPDNVTSIVESAFSGCFGLTSITIPNSVTNIGESAFSGCSGLTAITIPDSVTTIGANAFSGCSGLTSITIPDSVTTIGANAFSGCSDLETVFLPISFEGTPLVPADCSIVRYEGNPFSEFRVPVRIIRTHPYDDNALSTTTIQCPSNAVFVLDVKKSVSDDNYQYVCGGWRGTGSISETGTSNAVSFVATEASSIEWLWTTNVWIELQASGEVTSNFQSGWFTMDSSVIIAYEPTDETISVELSGDTDGVIWDKSARTIVVPTDRLRTISLVGTGVPVLLIMTDELPPADDHSQYWGQLEAKGGTGYREWDVVDGSLPSGMSLYPDGFLYAWRVKPGTYSFKVSVSDNSGQTDEKAFTMVVPQTETHNSPVKVPFEWLDRYGLAPDGDYERAAVAMSANGLQTVCECFLAGLDPTNAQSRLEVGIWIENGRPIVTWEPDLSGVVAWEFGRSYHVEGKERLSDPAWGNTNASTRFFRVTVSPAPLPAGLR